MSLTASALITAAKQRTYGAIGQQRISDAMLLAELSSQDSIIWQEITQYAPDLLSTITGTATCTFASNSTGYTLSTGIHYRDFTHLDASGNYIPINLVSRQDQDMPGLVLPAGMLHLASGGNGGVFYPIDPEGNRWTLSGGRNWFDETSGHVFKYSYVPAPTVLTTLASTLTSPELAREFLVNALILAILVSTPGVEQTRIQVAAQGFSTARSTLMFQIYKFGHPAGQRSSPGVVSETAWVDSQIG